MRLSLYGGIKLPGLQHRSLVEPIGAVDTGSLLAVHELIHRSARQEYDLAQARCPRQ